MLTLDLDCLEARMNPCRPRFAIPGSVKGSFSFPLFHVVVSCYLGGCWPGFVAGDKYSKPQNPSIPVSAFGGKVEFLRPSDWVFYAAGEKAPVTSTFGFGANSVTFGAQAPSPAEVGFTAFEPVFESRYDPGRFFTFLVTQGTIVESMDVPFGGVSGHRWLVVYSGKRMKSGFIEIAYAYKNMSRYSVMFLVSPAEIYGDWKPVGSAILDSYRINE